MKITERLYKILPATFPRFHITIERWKFNEQYKVWVSNQGHVLDNQKQPVKVMTSSKRYMVCKINKELVPAHRLVLMTWQPCKEMHSLTVDHINSNPRDNRLCNLEWVTEEEHKRRAAENFVSIPLTQQEKEEQKIKEKAKRVAKEKENNFGLSKQELSNRKLDILTKRFSQGELSVVWRDIELSYVNCSLFAAEQTGTTISNNVIGRRLICAAYRNGKYLGKTWKFKGNIEISKEEILNV